MRGCGELSDGQGGSTIRDKVWLSHGNLIVVFAVPVVTVVVVVVVAVVW